MKRQSGIVVEQGQLSSDPSSPSSGYSVMYPKTDGEWYYKNPDGTVKRLNYDAIIHSITVSDSPYTITETVGKVFIFADASGGAITINFPTAVGNKAEYHIKRTDNTPANLITLDPFSTQTIDGNSTVTIIFKNTCVSVKSNNSNLQRF